MDLEALENFEILDLSYNNVDGFKRIHVSQTLNQLEILLLSGSSLRKDFLQSLGSMVSLKMLTVDSSALNGDISSHEWLCQLKRLELLDISQNGLQGQLPLCFGNLTSLQHLDMRQNNLYGKLPFSLANLTSLHFLDLSSNQFVGNITSSPLTKLRSLHLLSLSNNNGNTVVQDSAHQPFTPSFQLLSLSLSNCNIQAKVPDFILHQYKFRYLELPHSSIGRGFPSWILENNTRLGALLLGHNVFVGSLHLSRTPHIHIKALDVSCNNISHLSTILSQSLPNVVFLNFSRNSIKDITPSSFGGMVELGFLDLSYNHLYGEMPKPFIEGCFSLQILILSHNTSEAIPSLSNSSSLRILRFNDNISGRIPLSFLPTSLTTLDIITITLVD
ncbi:hypothetical protein V2J09_002962 [Rumex salicifolius]